MNNTFFKGKLILAPMAGISNSAFREICRDFGADMSVGEMVSAKALWYGDKKSAQLLHTTEAEQPVIPQIFGSDPEIMASSAKKVIELTGAPAIDINMGCPVHKVISGGDGSALMKNPDLIFDIVKAVTGAVDVPVTVKIRAGFEKINAVECALSAESAGAAAITVHGRTRTQMYAPPVNLDIIAQVKEAVGIPVIGNGDVKDGKSAKEMLETTGCDSIMVGRAALGNPFIFEEIKAYLSGQPYEKPSLSLIMDTARRHVHALVALKGERIGILEARGQLAWYIRDIRGGAALRAQATKVSTLNEADEFINSIHNK